MISATYRIEGKYYRFCDCDNRTNVCKRGGERKMHTAGYSQCLLPVDGVFEVGDIGLVIDATGGTKS